MTAILYPVASNAEQALATPLGRAAREREAAKLAGQAVAFVTDATGPAFATREAALEAYAGRVEDDRPGKVFSPVAEDRFCRLAEQVAPDGGRRKPPAPVKPTLKDGRRWPEAKAPPATIWRLQVSYWRLVSAEDEAAPRTQARLARRGAADALEPEALRRLTRQPLQPIKPQQPLDIGLFETRLPEAPHIIVPDE